LTVKSGGEKCFSRFKVFLPGWKIPVGLWWEHLPELRKPTNGKKGAAAVSGTLRDFHSYCRHQFLEAHQV
jgi:hypothetical protein